ncbi:MAG: phosphoribosyl-AMP cyclohydrolase [Acidimicrobiales bacterium]
MSATPVPEGQPGEIAEAAAGVPLEVSDRSLLAEVKFDQRGLVVAVVQDAVGGEVLTVAYMNHESLLRTLATGRTWFWSRSRNELWCKGETSGDRQYVREIRLDCDGDAVLVLVDQHGDGACHTKSWSCFFRTVGRGPGVARPGTTPRATPSARTAGPAPGPSRV